MSTSTFVSVERAVIFALAQKIKRQAYLTAWTKTRLATEHFAIKPYRKST